MRTHSLRTAATLLLSVVVFGGTVLTGTASAGQAEGAAGTAAAAEAAAEAYRRGYPGISAAQARAAVAGEVARRALYDAVGAHPATFGGAWFDPPSGIVHIAVTAEPAARTAAGLAARLGLRLRTHLVERSLAELEQVAERIRGGADDLALAAAGNVGIDVPTNRVLISLPGNRLSAGAEPLALPPGVGVADQPPQPAQPDVCTTRANCNDTIMAGIYLNGGSCSVGFTVRGNGVRYVLTAGHCSSGIGATWSVGGTTFGTMEAARNSGALDVAIIRIDRAPFTGQTGGMIYCSGCTGNFFPVVGSLPNMNAIVIGERICLSANIVDAAGANFCGTIGSGSDASNRGLARVNGLDACPGESGGGWYWPADQGRFAYGIHSRSDQGCRVSGGRSWFTALPRIGTTFGFTLSVETR